MKELVLAVMLFFLFVVPVGWPEVAQEPAYSYVAKIKFNSMSLHEIEKMETQLRTVAKGACSFDVEIEEVTCSYSGITFTNVSAIDE